MNGVGGAAPCQWPASDLSADVGASEEPREGLTGPPGFTGRGREADAAAPPVETRIGGPGRSRLAVLLSISFCVGLANCSYSFRAGSFPPEHIQTVAVLPFENETTRFELPGELHELLVRNLPAALGIRPAGEAVADAVVRGTISGYVVAAGNYSAGGVSGGARVNQRTVTISVSVEIVDLVENVVLWEARSLRSDGYFLEASENEETGKAEAMDLLVQKIVDGAQSNW